jgi:hypothetical protein
MTGGDNLRIVFYSDKNYEYQAESLIKSILINSKVQIDMVYYTIGFTSDLEYPNLTKRYFPKSDTKTKFEFYKPAILIDAIDTYPGYLLFLDTDIIMGHRFNPKMFMVDTDYPMLSFGNWDFPFICKFEDGKYNNVCDESNLMKYFNIPKRTMNYVYTCVIALNEKCRDFVLEWKSVCENEYLQSYGSFYYPFPDETALNVILWRRGIASNYGRIYLNTLKFEPLKYVEENENVTGNPNTNYGIFDNDLLRCDNSSNVIFYHGIKDRIELEKTIIYLNEKNSNT